MKVKLPRAVALIAWSIAIAPSLLAQDSSNHPRIISVTGTAEIKVAPDEVTLLLGIDSHDKDLLVAKAENDKRGKKLLNLVHSAGVDPKNIQTSALTMGPEYTEEKIPKFLGYRVSQVVTVTLRDLSRYEDLMTSILKVGVNRVDGITFLVADPQKYREEARLKAVQAARDKATTMARQLGLAIGKPWEITEGTDIDSQDMAANFLSSVRYRMPMQQEQSTVAGGEVTIRALVRISFQLE
jgi:uncharacterized protein YggE